MLANFLGVANPLWHEQAACRNSDPKMFFEKGEGYVNKAKALCNTCPVIQECLNWTLLLEKHNNQISAGIYAGMTPAARSRITLCKHPKCLVRVKKARSYCSQEHKNEHDEMKKPHPPKQEFYLQGTLHTNGHHS